MTLIFHEEEWSWNILSLWQFIEERNYPVAWSRFFEKEEIMNILKEISKKIVSKKPIYPPINRVFRTFTLPKEKIRVVILGMDPYHNPGSAVGLCFSVPKGGKINPSLRNIYSELEREGYTGEKNGDLSHWLEQGVFMLNTALTVEEGSPDSHTDAWYDFSRAVIREINDEGVIWLLMGAKAIAFQDSISGKVIKTSHPSPFSAHRNSKDASAFLGSGAFTRINSYLEKQSLPMIKWLVNVKALVNLPLS